MAENNFVVDIIENKREDGNYEVVFVLQNGEKTEPIVLGLPVDKEKFLP